MLVPTLRWVLMSTGKKMNGFVKYNVQDNVAVLTVNNPPVNALGNTVCVGLIEAIARAEADIAVQAILIHGQGCSFPSGADIKEFDVPPLAPSLPQVCDRIEACIKPVIAALHGTVLGDGLELALAAHYRIAQVGTKIGLPEVNLGLPPGAGGTQRSPRLCGVAFALSLMLSGKPIGAFFAKKRGLIDEVCKEKVLTAGLGLARDIITNGAAARRTLERREALQDPIANLSAIQDARDGVAGSVLLAPAKIVDCVEASLLLPPEAGKIFERTAFEDCLASDQSVALRHVFMAERLASKVPEQVLGKPRGIENVGIIGGGTMGAGIAVSMLEGGLNVVMVERDAASLEAGLGRVLAVFEQSVAKNRLTPELMNERLARLSGSLQMSDLAEVDLAIEAVVEDRAVKEDVFAQLDAVLKQGAILATNTSYLDIDELAATVSRPQDVVGFHFFSPANIMRLLEIVVAEATSDDVVASGFVLANRLGKIGVRAGVTDGFIGNRILKAYRLAAEYMVEDGASPYQVDRAMRDFGFGLGPFQVYDLAGLDIAWAQRKRLAATRDPAIRYTGFGDKMCEAGWFGQKTGRGFYWYVDGSRSGQEDQAVLDLIADVRGAKGIRARQFRDDEIQRRCLLAMVNEGAKLLEEGIALRPSDIDVVMIHGYGFARWRGGPMQMADQVGMLQIRNDLNRFDTEDTQIWHPAVMLDTLILNGQEFGSLNK